jgi:hypothetical protein
MDRLHKRRLAGSVVIVIRGQEEPTLTAIAGI